MSGWDAYLTTLVGYAPNDATHGCIIGKDGSKWTTDASPNALPIKPEEIKPIADALSKKNFTTFQASGVRINGTKYQFLREEDEKIVLAKKKDVGSITMQASKTAVIIGFCPEGKQQGNLNKAVGAVADYLESLDM